MRKSMYIGLLIFLVGCNHEVEVMPAEKTVFDELGYRDYQDIVRHPVSLESTMDSTQASEISFHKTEFLFDTLKSGDVLNTTFNFTNTGLKPLYILDTRVSCGCTVVQFPEKAIPAGKGGSIDIEFDTEGKSGFQEKSITVLTNSYPNEKRLTLKGYVKNNDQ